MFFGWVFKCALNLSTFSSLIYLTVVVLSTDAFLNRQCKPLSYFHIPQEFASSIIFYFRISSCDISVLVRTVVMNIPPLSAQILCLTYYATAIITWFSRTKGYQPLQSTRQHNILWESNGNHVMSENNVCIFLIDSNYLKYSCQYTILY